jgi:hypothetical protein
MNRSPFHVCGDGDVDGRVAGAAAVMPIIALA